eukprot:8540394-Pyramimonas_sp.AAC.1
MAHAVACCERRSLRASLLSAVYVAGPLANRLRDICQFSGVPTPRLRDMCAAIVNAIRICDNTPVTRRRVLSVVA